MTPNAAQPLLDVSHLPESAFGTRTALWWGNTLLLVIEGMMFALLAATYYYLRMDFTQWPPVQPHSQPPLARPLPNLPIPTIILALQLLGCAGMGVAHRGALGLKSTWVRAGMAISLLLGAASIVLRFREFYG